MEDYGALAKPANGEMDATEGTSKEEGYGSVISNLKKRRLSLAAVEPATNLADLGCVEQKGTRVETAN